MANVTKRVNKSGDVSYLIRVFVDQGLNGKQVTKSMTWKPPANMRPSAADKQADKEAVLFEEKVRSGVVSLDGKTKFVDYAERWMENAELAPTTREQYSNLLKRINQAIGHVSLEKLRADQLQSLLKNLREDGIKSTGCFAYSNCFEEYRNNAKLSQRKLAELSGVSVSTIIAASRGKRVAFENAKKLCDVLKTDVSNVFTVEGNSDKLSDRTIWHHHKLIRAILASAKKSQLIPHNVAQEFMEAPKLPREEARYLNDKEAQEFVSALMYETDIRVKTALALDLFTGIRRGELCGLSWSDIDFKDNVVHIRKASQYVAGHGIIEVPTKNKSSTRDITVSSFVIDLLTEYHKWWLEQKLMHGDQWHGDKERLFIQEDGKPIFPGTINFWLRRFTEQNNLPKISPHALRHTFITLQITSGVDVRTLQARSGHAQASTLLNVYSHAIQSAQQRAAQVMDDVLLVNISDRKANITSG